MSQPDYFIQLDSIETLHKTLNTNEGVARHLDQDESSTKRSLPYYLWGTQTIVKPSEVEGTISSKGISTFSPEVIWEEFQSQQKEELASQKNESQKKENDENEDEEDDRGNSGLGNEETVSFMVVPMLPTHNPTTGCLYELPQRKKNVNTKDLARSYFPPVPLRPRKAAQGIKSPTSSAQQLDVERQAVCEGEERKSTPRKNEEETTLSNSTVSSANPLTELSKDLLQMTIYQCPRTNPYVQVLNDNPTNVIAWKKLSTGLRKKNRGSKQPNALATAVIAGKTYTRVECLAQILMLKHHSGTTWYNVSASLWDWDKKDAQVARDKEQTAKILLQGISSSPKLLNIPDVQLFFERGTLPENELAQEFQDKIQCKKFWNENYPHPSTVTIRQKKYDKKECLIENLQLKSQDPDAWFMLAHFLEFEEQQNKKLLKVHNYLKQLKETNDEKYSTFSSLFSYAVNPPFPRKYSIIVNQYEYTATMLLSQAIKYKPKSVKFWNALATMVSHEEKRRVEQAHRNHHDDGDSSANNKKCTTVSVSNNLFSEKELWAHVIELDSKMTNAWSFLGCSLDASSDDSEEVVQPPSPDLDEPTPQTATQHSTASIPSSQRRKQFRRRHYTSTQLVVEMQRQRPQSNTATSSKVASVNVNDVDIGQDGKPVLTDSKKNFTKRECFIHAVHNNPESGNRWYNLGKQMKPHPVVTDAGSSFFRITRDGVAKGKEVFTEDEGIPDPCGIISAILDLDANDESIEERKQRDVLLEDFLDHEGWVCKISAKDSKQHQSSPQIMWCTRIDCFARAVECNPFDTYAWYYLGHCLAFLPDEGEKSDQKAQQSQPTQCSSAMFSCRKERLLALNWYVMISVKSVFSTQGLLSPTKAQEEKTEGEADQKVKKPEESSPVLFEIQKQKCFEIFISHKMNSRRRRLKDDMKFVYGNKPKKLQPENEQNKHKETKKDEKEVSADEKIELVQFLMSNGSQQKQPISQVFEDDSDGDVNLTRAENYDLHFAWKMLAACLMSADERKAFLRLLSQRQVVDESDEAIHFASKSKQLCTIEIGDSNKFQFTVDECLQCAAF